MTLQWSTTLSGVGFGVCWDTTPNGTCDGAWWPNGASGARTVSGLAPGTTYWWQVRTSDGLVYGDNGTWWSFTTAAAPAPITKGTPGNGSTQGSTVTLQWTTTLTDPGYSVCWDSTNNGTCDTMWWPNGGSTARTLESLSPGTYYWQVRSGNGTVLGDNGTWWSFTVPGAPEASGDAALVASAWTRASGIPRRRCLEALARRLAWWRSPQAWRGRGVGGRGRPVAAARVCGARGGDLSSWACWSG